jgi:Flp pilus assembly protein TadG
LILLLFGIIESGRMIMVHQSLTTAAREGARKAIVQGTSAAQAKAAVESFLADVGVRGTSVKVTAGATAAHGEPIKVSVTVPFKRVSWLPSPFFFGKSTLSASATMRRETPD